MDGCLALACGSSDSGVPTKIELDRYTDNVTNVLTDEKGRKFFRSFMYTCKMRHGIRVLNFWVHIDKVLNYRRSTENMTDENFYEEIDDIIKQSDKIEADDVDFATVTHLMTARENEDRDEIVAVLKILKAQARGALKQEFKAFRRHYTRK
jgi:hypothetical protein